MRITTHEKLTAGAFVAPAVLLVGLFVIWPTINMVWMSFQRDLWSTEPTWVGATNYANLAADPVARQAMWNTLLFAILVVPFQTALALGLAVWVNQPGWPMRLLRIGVFIPTTVSLAVLSVVWNLMVQPETMSGSGLINGLLVNLGLPPQPFLTSTSQALPTIVVMSIWQGVGLQMLVFVSGLQQIPMQRYEAAQLDGAGPWQRFVNITLPGVAPTGVFVVMVTTIFALRLFVQPYLMTRGGPDGATRSIVQYVYEAAFLGRDLGLACAAGTVFFVVVLAITISLRRLLRAAEVAE